ncbi:MAG: sulfatase [Alphaproteobacteria bacterium]|nr:sulfatase [Alphaproteobacteria bacterium]
MLMMTLLACLAEPPQDAGRAGAPLPDPAARHVIWVSIDTLRADALGAYGNADARTPVLDRLAAEGVLFETALTPHPTTLPSHTTMMTGTWAHTHGVARNRFIVPAEDRMLAEVLSAQGFEAAGFIGATPLRARFGFDQGFGFWDEDIRDATGAVGHERSAAEVTDAALAWLETHDPERAFLFVHYYDVHAPYDPPAPCDALYPRPDPGVDGGWLARRDLRLRRDAGEDLTAAVETLRGLYLGELACVDAQLGRLVDALDARGLLDDALLIVTSDHGESFDAHWEFFDHGGTVYDEALAVPLILRQPGGRGGGARVAPLVSTMDLYPTVLERLGLPAEPQVEGISLAPLLEGQPFVPHERLFLEASKPEGGWTEGQVGDSWTNGAKCRAVRGARYKRVRCPARDEAELFDLTEDPAERLDLDARPWAWPLTQQLDAALADWDAAARPWPAALEDSEDTIRQLEALGYVEER